MFTKIFIVTIMIAILGCLGSGLYYLITSEDQGKHIVKALTWRIALSVFLFILLLLGFATGLIKPHGV